MSISASSSSAFSSDIPSFVFGDERGRYTSLQRISTAWIGTQLAFKTPGDQIRMLLDGISQLHSIREPQTQKVMGLFKKDLYLLAVNNAEEVRVIIGGEDYKHNDALKDVLSSLEYKTSTYGQRALQNLKKSLCGMQTMSKGAAYLLGGVSAVGSGITLWHALDSLVALGVGCTIGAVLIAVPLGEAGCNARKGWS